MEIKFKGAVFDVDGTILDSMDVWFYAAKKLLLQLGIKMSDSDIDAMRDMTLEESIPMILSRHKNQMSPHDITKQLMELAGNEYRENILPKPNVCEYIKRLHENGVKIAIATSGFSELAKSAFERIGIWQYIDAAAYSSEVMKNKSNPDVYLLAAERIGVAPKDCIVFEDLLLGIKGAKSGGFFTCAVADKSNTEDHKALKETADLFIRDFSELMN